MRFSRAKIPGAFIIDQERHTDERGYFARTWCEDEFGARGLERHFAQCSASFNHHAGTLRGLHYQVPPFAEAKHVRCTRGALFDVAVDLRPESPTFRDWIGIELTADNGTSLYLPRGVAHGFMTLADATEIAYQITSVYSPAHARGLRWNDPFISIEWPRPVEVIHPRDRDYDDVSRSSFSELMGLFAP